MSSYLSFDALVQYLLLLPPVLAFKHASSDLKPFAILLHEFSAGSGSQISSCQGEGKGYKFSRSYRNTKYTVQ